MWPPMWFFMLIKQFIIPSSFSFGLGTFIHDPYNVTKMYSSKLDAMFVFGM